jgi:formate-dependent nitrite reductase membrane component NrfD
MRRWIVSASLAYLLVAFAFIILTMLNASDEGRLVVMAEADAGVVVTLSAIGLVVTILLALRILVDNKERHDLEREFREPRRRSDINRNP